MPSEKIGQLENRLQSLKVVVTGAGGAIGSRLVARLAGLGAKVSAVDLHKPEKKQQLEGVRYLAADIMDIDALRADLGGAEIVYHLAYLMGEEANRDPVAAARINTLGGTSMFQACLDAGVARVLMASSITVFGSQRDYAQSHEPLGDQAIQLGARGIPVYAAGKIYLEKVARFYSRKYGLVIGGLRPGAVIGCSRNTGRAKTIANIVASAAAGETQHVENGLAAFQAIHIDDVVGGFLALATADQSLLTDVPFFNLAGDYATMRSYCNEVAQALPDARFEISDGNQDELFGSSPFVVDDGIHRLVGYDRQHKSLRDAIRAEVDNLATA